MQYLGIPIFASRFTKMKCTQLMDKILTKVQMWQTRHLSFAGMAAHINSVIFDIISNWASIFVMPHEVIERINQICRNFSWGGAANFKRIPHILLGQTCLPRNNGGLGIQDFATWNKAKIAKLIWLIAEKKDVL